MTAYEAYHHEHYLDSKYDFEGEEWTDVNINGLFKYEKSNFYRLRNKRTGHVMKPFEHGARKRFAFILSTNEGQKIIMAHNIFDDFDVPTRHALNGTTGFIMDAF